MCSWYYSFQIPIGHQLWKLDVDDTDLLINKLIPKHKENLCFFGLDLITDEASGGKYLVFLSSRSVQMRDSSAFSVCTFIEESVFIFQFLNDKNAQLCQTKHNSSFKNWKLNTFPSKSIQTEKAEEYLGERT